MMIILINMNIINSAMNHVPIIPIIHLIINIYARKKIMKLFRQIFYLIQIYFYQILYLVLVIKVVNHAMDLAMKK